MPAAIANGELQGAISTNPWSAKQLTDAGGVVIVDGTDDGVIEDIIGSASYELFTVITSDALIESDPELVQSAVNAMAKAIPVDADRHPRGDCRPAGHPL